MALSKADQASIAALVAAAVAEATTSDKGADEPKAPKAPKATPKAETPVVSLKGTNVNAFVAIATKGGKNAESRPYRDGPRVRLVGQNAKGQPYVVGTLPRPVFEAIAGLTKANLTKLTDALDSAGPAHEALVGQTDSE